MRSQIRRLSLLALALAAVTFLVACDPGFIYRPTGWRPIADEFQWVAEFQGLTIRTPGLAGLSGSFDLDVSFEVRNDTSVDVVLENATLTTPGNVVAAILPGNGEKAWRTIPAHQSARIYFRFGLGEAAVLVLGVRPQLSMRFATGEQEYTLEIEYERFE